jgi:putative hydrolase of the HAD superfamily
VEPTADPTATPAGEAPAAPADGATATPGEATGTHAGTGAPTAGPAPAAPAGQAHSDGLDGLDPGRVVAVSLDVGGVLTVPRHDALAAALARAAVAHDLALFTDGHYRAMAEVDRCLSVPEEFGDYRRGFLLAVGTPAHEVEAGALALAGALTSALWHQVLPGAVEAARRLLAAGFRLGVTSNADGTVAEMLQRHGVLQVGPGAGVAVEVVTDSGVLGVAKPDPAMFLATAAALGLPPEQVCHIGDSGYYDAEGARAVGMIGVHVDPLGLCPDDRHHHARSLAHLADHLSA